MSIARSFTKRIKRDATGSPASTPASPPVPRSRSQSQSLKSPGLAIDRAKISAPVALVSTTNMLSYNAPDIVPAKLHTASTPKTSTFSSTASTHSADDSDHSTSGRSRASSHASRDTLTDASSVSSSSPTSPAPNHLSGYFAAATNTTITTKNVRKSVSSGNLQQLREHVAEKEPVVPAIPERALSHSKRAHERLAQKRSLQNIPLHSASAHAARPSREHRTSLDMFNSSIKEEEPIQPPQPQVQPQQSQSHPFGRELEQLNEVAEEFGGVVRSAAAEADLAIMRERNLASFCAADYLQEIMPLFGRRFGAERGGAGLAWI